MTNYDNVKLSEAFNQLADIIEAGKTDERFLVNMSYVTSKMGDNCGGCVSCYIYGEFDGALEFQYGLYRFADMVGLPRDFLSTQNRQQWDDFCDYLEPYFPYAFGMFTLTTTYGIELFNYSAHPEGSFHVDIVIAKFREVAKNLLCQK